MKIKILCTINHTMEIEADNIEDALNKINIVDVEKNIIEYGSQDYSFTPCN